MIHSNKIIVFILIFLLGIEQMVFATSSLSSIIDRGTKIKFGELSQDEIWDGKIFLIGDVTVPIDKRLLIKPGTKIIFDERDICETGEKKNQCELIVYGTLEAEADAINPIQMISIQGFDSQKVVDLGSSVRVIRFSPYKIDTDPLKKEFHSYKNDYFLFWGVIFLMWVFVRSA